MKRVVIISDLHCGHVVGLTPPSLQNKEIEYNLNKHNKFAKLQDQCWEFYAETINSLRDVDILIVNGDCIEGKGERSGGTELITTDRQVQCSMAATAINYANAKTVIMTYGTAYHTGDKEDWENSVASQVHAKKIGSHEWVNVNGVIFDVKHHIGSSSIPHGRFTAIARDRLWNALWSEHDEQPKADVIVRSHVHYHVFAGDNDYLALTTPALQAMGSKYGARRCSGHVDFGLVSFDISDKGGYTWKAHIARIQGQKATAIKL